MSPNGKLSSSSLFFALVLTISSISSFAQKMPLVNSGDLIRQGSALHDEKKYKKAIELYKQIPRSDTNYADALYELSYSFYADSQLENSLKYAKEGLRLFPEKFTKFSLQAANALDDMNKPDEALTFYTQALAKDPQSSLLYFNRGVVQLKHDRDEEAKKDLQQCLLINPYHSSAHYFLGLLYIREGKLIPAMLAFKTYLLLAPTGKYSVTTLKLLNSIAKVTDEVLEYVKQKKPGKEDNFDMLQEILLSKIALDKQYKLQADLEDNIVRQIQVIDEKLEYNKNDKGFCMQFYVPFYAQMFSEGEFEPMVFSLFAGFEIKDVDNWNKKHKKTIEAFATKAVNYFNEIKFTRVLVAADRKNASITHLYSDGQFLGKGTYVKGKNDKYQASGVWEFFHDNGALKAKGAFNSDEKKQGEWNYYYDNGQLKEKINYKDGEQDKLAEGWFTNGSKWYNETYKDGQLEGVQTMYYYNDIIRKTTTYKANKKNGPEKSYNSKGQLTYSANYVDDLQDGIAKSFYGVSGVLMNEVMYKKDKAQGTYKSYSDAGVLIQQGEFVDDLRQGLWTTYYNSGSVKEKTTYKDNEITGEFTEYFEDGKLSRKGNYTKKKIDGKLEDFDDDGKLWSDAVYEKGKLKEINFYDKSGKNISNTTTRKGAADITFYSAEGLKVSQCYFNKDGNRDGKNTVYFPSGKISEETNYKEGEQEGANITYYPNGKKRVENNFTAGDEDGYTKGYFANGKTNYEGWVIKGDRQQQIIFYNTVGDVTVKENYLDNDLDGYTEYSYPGNVPDFEYRYHTGWLEEITQFDTTGKVIATNVLKQGKGPVVYKHFNGKKAAEGTYEHYMLTGPYKIYFFDETVSSSSNYKNDEREGEYKSYYYGGALRTTGQYKAGKKDGLWKYFYEDGKLYEEETYKDGNLDGPDKSYNPDGTLDKVISFKDNNKDGEYKIYGENNQLAVILYYKNDDIKSYSYEDKTGKLVTPIIIKAGTGKVIGYYKNGTQSAEIVFVDNDVQGTRKFFYSTGKPYIDGNREFGYDNGPKKVFYPNGNPWKEENYVLNNLNGLRKVYYPNGKLRMEENYYNDEQHGTCKYYDETGKLKQTRVYYYGNLLSVK